MTRERLNDFEELRKYVDSYNLSACASNPNYLAALKKLHKVYFSLLAWNAEVDHNREAFTYASSEVDDESFVRIEEFFSDLGAAFFNFSQGAYKSSRIMLRVGIENFVRGISSIERPEQLAEKNVYALFDQADQLTIFNSSAIVRECYEHLHSDYKLLCLDTHTATRKNMEHVSALGEFPRFNTARADETVVVFLRVSKNALCILCLLFNNFFHRMHHRNKENVLISVPRTIRPAIHGIE